MGLGKEDEPGTGKSAAQATFQGVANYPPPPPPGGFPQPPGASEPPQYGYVSVPVPVPVQGIPVVAEGAPVRPPRERRLRCCGLGCGWCLFIIGFFLGAIPWYVGVLILLCNRHHMDPREKPGYVACAIAAIVATVAIIIGSTSPRWS